MPKKGKEKHEKALQEKLKELETEGWKVINLHAKSPDGIAVKDEKHLIVEVKGFPSDKYVKEPNKGEKNRTHPNSQAIHWFAEALLQLVVAKSNQNQIDIAMGLPCFDKYNELISSIQNIAKIIDLEFLLVNEKGNVDRISF